MRALISLLLLLPAAAFAHDDERLWQAIEQLNSRIEQLEARAGGKTEAPVAQTVAIRYWLASGSPLDADFTEPPLRQGNMPLADLISLEPKTYGQDYQGMFNPYLDPSRYPVATVVIDAELLIDKTASYQLVVKPTPPREVGGAGSVKLMVEIAVAGKPVYTLPLSSSLATQQHSLQLSAGREPVRITVVAKSPGFGPSPAHAHVFIGLQAEGEISPKPIRAYLAPAR